MTDKAGYSDGSVSLSVQKDLLFWKEMPIKLAIPMVLLAFVSERPFSLERDAKNAGRSVGLIPVHSKTQYLTEISAESPS